MLQNCSIVSKDASLRAYHAQDAKPGEPKFSLSVGDLLEIGKCASRFIASGGSPRHPASKWREFLACLHLTPRQLDLRFAFRPDSYQTQVLTCPACGSVTDAQICRKCHQRRRLKEVQKPWSGSADYCAKWTQRALERNQTIIKTDERTAADQALKRLLADPAIADFRDSSDCSLWLKGQWHDADTGRDIPVRTLIAYWPKPNSTWGRALGDFKTPRDAGHGAWTRLCYYAGYHVRAALALDLFNAATGEDRNAFFFVLSECTEPFEPARRQLTPQFIGLGRKTYQNLLAYYARCLHTQQWPSYDALAEGQDAWTAVDLEPWMERGVGSAPAAGLNQPEPQDLPTSHAE